MEKQKRALKNLIKTGVVSGLFFATFMVVFDYFDKTPFSILKFLIGGTVFGCFTAYSKRYINTKN